MKRAVLDSPPPEPVICSFSNPPRCAQNTSWNDASRVPPIAGWTRGPKARDAPRRSRWVTAVFARGKQLSLRSVQQRSPLRRGREDDVWRYLSPDRSQQSSTRDAVHSVQRGSRRAHLDSGDGRGHGHRGPGHTTADPRPVPTLWHGHAHCPSTCRLGLPVSSSPSSHRRGLNLSPCDTPPERNPTPESTATGKRPTKLPDLSAPLAPHVAPSATGLRVTSRSCHRTRQGRCPSPMCPPDRSSPRRARSLAHRGRRRRVISGGAQGHRRQPQHHPSRGSKQRAVPSPAGRCAG